MKRFIGRFQSVIFGIMLGGVGVVMPVPAGTSYVWTGGTPTPPYDTWATAANDIQTAIHFASTNLGTYDTVVVTDGIYSITAEIAVTNAVIVRSLSGWTNTIVRAAAGNMRLFKLSHSGAVVQGFTIREGNAPSDNFQGAGVYMSAGTLRDCVVSNNNNADGAGIGMVGGIVQNCIVTRNATASSGNGSNIGGGGILVNGGSCIIRNCLIMGNTAAHTGSGAGGGILRNNGSCLVENCTVVGNRASGTSGGAGGVHGAMGLTNSIVYLNSTASAGDADVQGATSGYSCSPSLSGNGNFNGDPQFVAHGSGYGAAHVPGNYRLQAASTCLDSGTNLVWSGSATDLDGNSRLVGSQVDMGSYELNPNMAPLGCRFTATPTVGTNSLQTVVTAVVGGSNVSSLVYYWNFGDGQMASGSDKAVVTNTYSAGTFTISLSVTNIANEGAAQTQSNLVTVLTTATTYCSPSGGNIPPYTNWTMAATNIQDAIDQTLGLVLVSNGTYNIGSAITISKAQIVQSVNGPSNTVIRRTSGTTRVVRISDSGAVLDGFTIRDGNMSSSGSGIYMDAGTVRNCIVTDCTASSGFGVGIYMVTGLVEKCTIAGNWGRDGAGIALAGGVVQNCIISRNKTDTAGGGNYGGGGILVNGTGYIRTCLIMGNSSLHTGNGRGGGVALLSGKAYVDGCTIVGNYGGYGAGGVDFSGLVGGGTLCVTNSIIRLNTSASAGEQDLVCTSAGYSCSPSLSGGGNVATDPLFVSDGSGVGESHVQGDYHLQRTSPCLSAALVVPWMYSALDLDGKSRIVSRPDMGVYEGVSLGTTLILR